MCRAPRLWRTSWLALALVCLFSPAVLAATLYDPALRFRQFHTEHFVIYFHQGEEMLARRLATIAEQTWQAWRMASERAGLPPPQRTHVVLADQADLSNGWATPVPYNTIFVTAAAPSGFEFIGANTDWLRIVFTHEFTHIVHLGRSRSWARLVKGIFGRVPLAFPNMFLPGWEIEGFATYMETAFTGEGRVNDRDFRAIEREFARGGRTFPMDRANGGTIAWPGGHTAYAFGAGFHAYLAEPGGGMESLIRVGEQSAGRVPYTASRVFKGIFGDSLGTLWKSYQRSLSTPALQPFNGNRRQLTNDGFIVAGPRFAPACDGCASEILYSSQSPNEFPSLKTLSLSGGAPRTIATRYLGATTGVGGDTIVFDQLDLIRNVGLYSDLYVMDRRSGKVRRLTHEARLLDPDLSPDGRTIVAVREERGRRDLVTLALGDDDSSGPVVTLRSEAETQFSAPRWSPDGRSVAAERRQLGLASEIVIVEVATGTSRAIATGTPRATTPTWRPDGGAVIAATDQAGGPLNLFEFVPQADRVLRRQLTFHEVGGALWPELSPDGSTLVYAKLTENGFNLFRQVYFEDLNGYELSQQGQSRDLVTPPPAPDTPSTAYRPWPTLLPRAWTPILAGDSDQVQLGVSTGGFDVLGYHGYAASILWRMTAPDAVGLPSSGSPDWSVGYAYDRWRPRLFVSASRSTSFFTGASAVGSRASTLDERTIEAGVFLPFRRVRRTERLLFSGLRSASTASRILSEDEFTRVAGRTAWAISTAHIYGYSISPEDGVSAGVTGEAAGASAGDLDQSPTATADFRAYLPGVGRHHVVAVRIGGGVSSGPRDYGRTFRLGGATSNADVIDFGRGAFSLLRGFPSDTFAGRRIGALNLDYRAPLLRLERGVGTWPFFVRTVHGAVFADLAHAWTGAFSSGDVKTSFGGEISTDIVAGYSLPFTFTAGVARGHDGAGQVGDTTTAYIRIGRAF